LEIETARLRKSTHAGVTSTKNVTARETKWKEDREGKAKK
jgi:hypothetical protein